MNTLCALDASQKEISSLMPFSVFPSEETRGGGEAERGASPTHLEEALYLFKL